MFIVEILGRTEKHKKEKHALYPDTQITNGDILPCICDRPPMASNDLHLLVFMPSVLNQADGCKHENHLKVKKKRII